MNMQTINHSKASVAILGTGLVLGLALKFLEFVRPAGAALGL